MKYKLAAVALAVIALGGCSLPTSITGGNAPAVQVTPSLPSTPAYTPAAVPTPTPTKAATYLFGDTVTWESGLSVTISKVAPYKPSKYAAGVTQANQVVVTVTLKNGTTAPFDPVLFMVSAVSGSTEADEIYDSQNGIGGNPSTKVLPGREVSWKVALSVTDPADIVAEVAPDFNSESAMFTTK